MKRGGFVRTVAMSLLVMSLGVHQCREVVTSLHYAALITDLIQSHIWWLLLIGMPSVNCPSRQESENQCMKATMTVLQNHNSILEKSVVEKDVNGHTELYYGVYPHCFVGCLT